VSTADLSRLAPREREFVEGIEDESERETIASTILRYRQPDRLHEGDEMPPLELLRLDGTAQPLEELVGGRPLVLIFGSFT
jgi:hypothetical protein